MHHTVQVAIAHFPDRSQAIKELARTDESFRSLCEDLTDAVAALARWERSSSSVKEARCAEYRGLVRDLAAELAAELDRHSQS